jgi:Holliday junction resolvase
MAQTPEAKVKRKVTDQLKVLGAFYFYPVTGGYGSSGIPDIVGCYRGMFFAIECKAGKNKPTELQMHMMGKISAAAGNVMVVNEDNLGDVSEWIINLPLLPLLPTPGR